MKWAKELEIPNFYIVMRDEIKNLPENGEIYVIHNLHLKKQNGVHWSCFTRNVFFDSYGLEPIKEVEKVLSRPYIYSDYRLQNDEEFCGVLCLYVLYCLKEKNTINEIIKNLKKELLNYKNDGKRFAN